MARAQAALAWSDSTSQTPTSPPSTPPPPCAPLSDADLRSYLGPGGRLLRPHDLRLHVYHGGVEPGLRKVGSELFHSPLVVPKSEFFCPNFSLFPPQKVVWAPSCFTYSLLSPNLCSFTPILCCCSPNGSVGSEPSRSPLFVPKPAFFCLSSLLFSSPKLVWTQSCLTHPLLFPNPHYFALIICCFFPKRWCGLRAISAILFRPQIHVLLPQFFVVFSFNSRVGSEPSHPPLFIPKSAFFCSNSSLFPPRRWCGVTC